MTATEQFQDYLRVTIIVLATLAVGICINVASVIAAGAHTANSYCYETRCAAVDSHVTIQRKAKRSRHVKQASRHPARSSPSSRRTRPVAPPTSTYAGGLLSRAAAYIGTNPTGWSSLWCGRFMALIAPEAAARLSNPNMARSWANLPRSAPVPGAVVVLSRGRGGHVGVFERYDSRGNLIIVSGNHGRRVGRGTYPASRVIAIVQA